LVELSNLDDGHEKLVGRCGIKQAITPDAPDRDGFWEVQRAATSVMARC